MAKATLAHEAYKQLKNRIRLGEFADGEPITEAKVAEMIGVGRGPIREALVRLEFEGLIHRPGPHQSRRVRHVEDASRTERHNEYQMRVALDGLAARGAALHMTGQQIIDLRKTLDRVTAAIVEENCDARTVALDDFYNKLRTQCGNPLIAKAYSACGVQTFKVRTPELDQKLVERIPYQEHPVPSLGRVVDAIASHRPDEAEAEMRAWTSRVMEVLDELFGTQDEASD